MSDSHEFLAMFVDENPEDPFIFPSRCRLSMNGKFDEAEHVPQ